MEPDLNICRCCLSRDCYKNIFNEYYSAGRKEIYSEMLLKTFNIKIGHQDYNNKSLICNKCIARLQEAAAFKKLVLQSERIFTEESFNVANDGLINPGNEYNDDFCDTISVEFESDSIGDEELNQDSKFDDSLNLNNGIDNANDDDFEWTLNETLAKKGNKGHLFVIKLTTDTAKTPTDDANIQIEIEKEKQKPIDDDSDDGILDAFDINLETVKKSDIETSEIFTPIKESYTRKSDKKTKGKSVKKKIANDEGKKSKRVRNVMLQSERDLRDNTLKLVLNSNICLFESLKIKYRCFSCKEAFMTIKELKEHSNTHDGVHDIKKRIHRLRGLSYKFAEISNLKCKLCDHNCSDINELKAHLTEKHEIKFGETDEHFLIPYRIEEDFTCVVCSEKFNTFLRLSIHMNTHYTNNVCDICGASYINRLSLRMHVNSVHREKKCSMCSATFLTQNLRVRHMRKYHKAGIYRRYCLICNKTFPYTYQLAEHKIQEHGAERKTATCDKCGKTFNSPQNLKIHNRSVHIKERNYHCNMCDMRFFTKCDQVRHETSHELTKTLSCNLCDVKFKTKDSVRRHLRKQHGLP